MRMLILTMLMMSLVGCRSGVDLTKRHEAIQCSPVFVYVDDTKKLIDADKSYCNVRKYEFSLTTMGPVAGTQVKENISYCDRCVGFKNYTSFISFLTDIKNDILTDTSSCEAE